jgi:glycosyltransferase involved in cell wall biosynthesis
MRCPSLEELPPPPPGKTGWPWTIATEVLPPTRSDGSAWPRISIITPSYNQGQFLEETIRSVLLQSYPNLEYIVIDGGSSDGSAAIVKKYENWLAYWVSEKDSGQPQAINKGIARITGAVFNWINSDDLLLPAALQIIATQSRPDHALMAPITWFSERGQQTRASYGFDLANMLGNGPVNFNQPGIWLRVADLLSIGPVDESLQFEFDFLLMLEYLLRKPDVIYSNEPVAMFRLHRASKTASQAASFQNDRLKILEKVLADPRFARWHDVCRTSYRQRYWRYKARHIMPFVKPYLRPLLRRLGRAQEPIPKF